MCANKTAVAFCFTFLIAFSGVTHSAGEDLGSLICRDETISQEKLHDMKTKAKLGLARCQYDLGTLCYCGTGGISQDYYAAFNWFKKAAEQGHVAAQTVVGEMFLNGKGVPRDFVQAYKWLYLVTRDGDGPWYSLKMELRGDAAAALTSRQIEEIEKEASGWEPRINVEMPVLLSRPNPPFTETARKERVKGTIVLECTVRKDGKADNFKVLKSLGYGLDESALHTVAEKWSFKPATSYGQPIDYPIQIEITFETD